MAKTMVVVGMIKGDRGFFEYACLLAFLVLSVLVLCIALFVFSIGTVYDTDHFADTFFILGAAWRIHEGLQPVLDFGHFYGGFISQTLSWTMIAFGFQAQVFYIHSLILSGVLFTCVTMVAGKELSPTGLAAIALAILTLLLTRHPLELNEPVIRVVSTHSFFYNRFAQAAMLVVALFVAFSHTSHRLELLRGVVAGLLVGAVCLTKSTFVMVLPGLFLALFVARRWSASVGSFFGVALFVLIFDPSLARFFGSLDYALAHVGGGGGNNVGGLIRKSIQIPLYQPIAFGVTLFLIALCIRVRSAWLPLVSIVVFSGSVVAMTATMGGNGSLGQLALPTFIGVCFGCVEVARKNAVDNEPIAQSLSLVLVLAFVLPLIANMAGAAAEGYARASERLIDDGPYVRYVSMPENAEQSDGPTQYEMLAEGMTVLRGLGDPSQWGIVADSGITFEHPLLARPVASYPLWQRQTAPEFAPDRALGDDIDVILLARERTGPVGDILRSKITADFSVCMTSQYWDVFVHQRLALTTCPADQ